MKQGWELKRLVDISSHLGDGLHGTPKYTTDGDYYFINGNNLSDGVIEFKVSTKRVSIAEYKKYKKNLTDRTILVSINGTLGNVAFYNNEKIILGKSACYFNLLESVDKDFIKYVLSSPYFLDYAHKEATGATIKNVSLKSMREFKIPLPPLSEQQRIVSILDKAFAAIDKAKSNANQNLKNAKELFESYLQSVFENKDKDWEEKTLGNLSKDKNAVVSGPFGSNLKVSDYKEKGIPIFRLQNVGKGYFIDKDIKYISSEKAEELKYHSFISGDIILAKLGIPIGKTCIVPDKFKAGIIVADVVRIRPDKKVVDYNFLVYFLNTNLSVAQLTGNISGATRPRVNLSDVRNIKLNLPSLTEQQTIVNKLDTLSIETKKLEAIYQKKIEDLEELKKSILQKAFSGELNTTIDNAI